ncbi:hypothetical protein DFH28DRAFT_922982 [Melampsora americana]|nr:hypothetical protein DFH28DRAFT_922982 [Melampsora americana]
MLEMLLALLWIKRSAIMEKQVTDWIWISASSKRKQWLIDGMDKKVNSSALKEINKQRNMLRSRYTNSQLGSLDAERMMLNETAPPDFHYPKVKAKVQESCHKEKLCFESLITYLTFGPISFLKPLNWQAGIHQLIQLLKLAIALVEKQDGMEYHREQCSWNHLDCLIIQALKVSALVNGNPCKYKAQGIQDAMDMFKPQVLAEAIVLDFFEEVLNPRGALLLDGKPATERTPSLHDPELKTLFEVAAHQGQDMNPKLPAGLRIWLRMGRADL